MKPVVIFGASVMGEEALDCGVRPVCFVDNDPAKQKKLFHGYKVITFEELKHTYPKAIIIIAAKRYASEIFEQVSPYYEKVYTLVRQYANMVLNQLNVVVTERCTMRCKHCSSLMPYYKHPKDCDCSLILESLNKLLDCVKFVDRVEVLGGEPFLYEDLPIILEFLTKSDKILKIEVITNGTKRPSFPPDVFKHPKICVVINDYKGKGGDPNFKEHARQTSIDWLMHVFDKEGVTYRYNKHWAWADMGNFHYRGRGGNDLKRLFKKCNFNTCTELLNGKLYRCPRSSHGSQLGWLPDEDSISADTLTPENLRDFINKPFIGACNYCDGNTRQTLILEPAIQEGK
jgi:hypothetical protein